MRRCSNWKFGTRFGDRGGFVAIVDPVVDCGVLKLQCSSGDPRKCGGWRKFAGGERVEVILWFVECLVSRRLEGGIWKVGWRRRGLEV